MPATANVEVPAAFGFLFEPPLGAVRWRVAYGGRSSAKSWQFARALLVHGAERPLRILCCREFQSSIKDSVHRLLCDQIERLGLTGLYETQERGIYGTNGTEFFFKGLSHDIAQIKSTEGIDLCWPEEAESISAKSWEVLIPTIRKPGSEIWVSFNPAMESDPTYQRLVVDPPDRAIVRKVGYRDNPWLPQEMRDAAEELKRRDLEAYLHIWEGGTWSRSDAAILADRCVVREFTPSDGWHGPYFGADWGFAIDPTVLVKVWTADSCLWVEYDVGGPQLTNDDVERVFRAVPGAGDHVIRADSASPERIAAMVRCGLRMEACQKWDGSIKDGIAHLRNYHQIVIHPRCQRAMKELPSYRYKTDSRTGDILPVPLSGNDHIADAIRYALGPLIRQRGFATVQVRYA